MKRPCKACGMPIELIQGPNGKLIPAQRLRSIYVLDPAVAGEPRLRKLELPAGLLYHASHFETCPNASSFSRGKGPHV